MKTEIRKALVRFGTALLVAGGVLGMATSAQALSITDNFTRANSTTIGTGWTELRNTNWSILNNTVVMQVYEAANAPALLTYTGLGLETNFIVSADIKLDAVGVLNGLAFNVQNPTNFYAARFQSNTGGTNGFFQLLKFKNGSISALASISSFAGISPLAWYNVAITSPSPGVISYSITSNTTTLLTGSVTDGTSPFSYGNAGFYSASIGGNFDNFVLTTVPEPSISALFLLGMPALLATIRFRRRHVRVS